MKLPKQEEFGDIAVPVFVSPSGLGIVTLLQFLSYFLHPKKDVISQNLYFLHLQRHLQCFSHLLLNESFIQKGQLSFPFLRYVFSLQFPRATGSTLEIICFPGHVGRAQA